MAVPQRSLRQDIELLRTRSHSFETAVQVSFDKLKEQIQALEQRTHTLEARNQALKQQNLALEDRVKAVEEENRALRAVESDAGDSHELDFMMPAWISKTTSEDVTAGHVSETTFSENNSRSGSFERFSSPLQHQSSPTPTITNDDDPIVVWYENGTLATNAPGHSLDTQDWRDLLTAYARTHTFLTDKDPDWHSNTRTDFCMRDIVQKTKGSKSMQWTVASPGKFCCKRCLNTQRVCLKYSEENGRIEALPLPEEVRPENAPLGIRWFLAEQPNMSNKVGFKGLWKAS